MRVRRKARMKTIKAKKTKVKKVKPSKKKYCKYCKQFVILVDKEGTLDYICDKETVRYRDFKGDMQVEYSDLKPQQKNSNNDCIDYVKHWFYKLFWFLVKG